MATHFRKRIRISSALYLNIHMTAGRWPSFSITVGKPGANFNVGKRKDSSVALRKATVGIPGSGLRHDHSYRRKNVAIDSPSNPKYSDTKKPYEDTESERVSAFFVVSVIALLLIVLAILDS